MRKKIIISILAVFLASSLLFVAYRYLRIRNVYDEIYYDEISYLNPFKQTPSTIAKIASLATDEYSSDYKSGSILVIYESNYFPPDSSLNIYANKNSVLILDFEEKLSDKVQLSLKEEYNVKTKEMECTLRLSDDNLEGYDVPNSQIKSYLGHYGLTESDIQERFKLIETVFLQEWSDKYKSRFSAGDWGDVKVVTKW